MRSLVLLWAGCRRRQIAALTEGAVVPEYNDESGLPKIWAYTLTHQFTFAAEFFTNTLKFLRANASTMELASFDREDRRIVDEFKALTKKKGEVGKIKVKYIRDLMRDSLQT